MKKSTLAAQGGVGIAVIALLTTLVQADSIQYNDLNNVDVDINNAAIAANTVTAGEIIEIELEMEDKTAIWEVDIIDENNQLVTVEIDGQTGTVLSTNLDNDDDAKMLPAYAVSLAQAIDIVRSIEQGAIVEAELEHEDGNLIWEVESISTSDNETKFRVDAETGEILI